MTNDPVNGQGFIYFYIMYVYMSVRIYILLLYPLSSAHTNHPKSHSRVHTISYTQHDANIDTAQTETDFFSFVHIHIFRYIFSNSTHTHNVCTVYTDIV